MGKKNKDKNRSPGLDWIDSMKGKNSDLEERYGVEPVRFSKMDGGTWEEDTRNRENYQKNMVEGARNDYDTRRTLEAAALSGKKKAQDILDSGFKNISDIRNAQNFFEKAAKRHGQGGQFSNASDFMGLTQSMVERDRRKFEERLSETQLEDEDGEPTEDLKDIVLSDHMQKAKDRVDQWEGGNTPVYNPEALMAQKTGQKSMFADSSRKVYGINEEISIHDVNDKRTAAERFMEEAKQDVKDEYEFERDF